MEMKASKKTGNCSQSSHFIVLLSLSALQQPLSFKYNWMQTQGFTKLSSLCLWPYIFAFQCRD